MVFAIFLLFFFFDENCNFHRNSIGFHRIALFASVFLNRCDTFSPFNCPLTVSKPKKFEIFTATICFLFRMWKCERRSPCCLLFSAMTSMLLIGCKFRRICAMCACIICKIARNFKQWRFTLIIILKLDLPIVKLWDHNCKPWANLRHHPQEQTFEAVKYV